MRKYLLIILACFLSFSSLVTGSCYVSYCKTCYSTNSSKCLTCDTGYYKSSYKCYSCPTGCKTCSSSYYCTSCLTGYTLSSLYDICLKARKFNKIICFFSPHQLFLTVYLITPMESKLFQYFINLKSCKTCASGYYVNSKDTCSSCESHCSTCTSSTRCTKCNSGYYLSSYSCYSVLFSCFNYLLQSSTTTTTTSSSYSTVCSASHCYKCKSSNRYYCVECDFGYSDFSGSCVEIDVDVRSLLALYIILAIILPIIIIITIVCCIICARRRRIQRNVIITQPVVTTQAPIQMIPVENLEYQQNFQMQFQNGQQQFEYQQFGYNQQFGQYGSPQMCQVPEPVK